MSFEKFDNVFVLIFPPLSFAFSLVNVDNVFVLVFPPLSFTFSLETCVCAMFLMFVPASPPVLGCRYCFLAWTPGLLTYLLPSHLWAHSVGLLHLAPYSFLVLSTMTCKLLLQKAVTTRIEHFFFYLFPLFCLCSL